jgi:hypothetical protein
MSIISTASFVCCIPSADQQSTIMAKDQEAPAEVCPVDHETRYAYLFAITLLVMSMIDKASKLRNSSPLLFHAITWGLQTDIVTGQHG